MNQLQQNNSGSVREVVHSARQELKELLRKRAEFTTRIGTIKKTLSGLAQIFGDSILDEELLALMDRAPSKRPSGLTKACRAILMESSAPCTAEEMCAGLRCKFPIVWQRQKNPIASITTVLNRLVEYSEASCGWNEKRRRVWRWRENSAQRDSMNPDGAANDHSIVL